MKKRFRIRFIALKTSFSKHWIKILSLLCLAYFLTNKDLSFQVKMNASEALSATPLQESSWESSVNTWLAKATDALITRLRAVQIAHQDHSTLPTKELDPNLANTYSNMGFGDLGQPTGQKISKKRKKEAYVKRFAKLAQSEMRKYGIPASITLAQGLIETNAGESRLSTKNNNHFGMKCFSKKCKKNHCSNFTDDSHKDFFRIYKNAWESYRAHSLMLQGKRYRHLNKLGTTDYKSWAKGLKKAGYATDPHYAIKLIKLIESLKLHQYDQ